MTTIDRGPANAFDGAAYHGTSREARIKKALFTIKAGQRLFRSFEGKMKPSTALCRLGESALVEKEEGLPTSPWN